MTNEEKATGIALLNEKKYFSNSAFDGDSFNECKQSALEMAKWKDALFKEYLAKKKEGLIQKQDKCKTIAEYGPKNYFSTQIIIINEIIDELFGETEEVDSSDNDE